MKRNHTSQEIIEFIVAHVDDNPKTIRSLTETHFGVSRQAINRFLSNLVKNRVLSAEGNTRKRQYELIPTLVKKFIFTVSPDLKEDTFWRQNILPLLSDLKPNVLEICNYGFTEIMNNVIDHSESTKGYARLTLYPNKIRILVRDYGVGIFKKITQELHLEDERHAVLELTKGKITTDRAHHSGEGIFFTSKIFDEFHIFSGILRFSHIQSDEDNWLLQDEDEIKGTTVFMTINKDSLRTLNEVFDKYANITGDYSFSKTHVPVFLARYGNEQLISRSQAKRLLTRLEPFKEVFLDFSKVDSIGQAFADEIFRVYKNEHPNIQIVYINTSKQVENMIKRVQSGQPGDDQLKLGI
jgi:hypothetical protein